ncbi:MAG TPA: response regulator [Kofleriaceae bacterium]|nr:response regulator [Kofleriaceae bacterium]
MSADPYKYFRLEARELVDRLHAGVLDLDRNLGSGSSAELVRTLLRAAHTLKGAARAVRQLEIADHAHAIEGALEPFRDAGGVSRAAIEAILPRLDDMELRVRALGRPPDAEPVPAAGAAAGAASAAAGAAGAAPRPASEALAIEDARSLRAEIGDMDTVLDGVAETRAALGMVRRLGGQIEQVHRLAELVVSQLAPGGAGAPIADARATAAQLAGALGDIDRSFDTASARLDRELRGVHDAAEQLRLVPASALFTALERSARDAARALGKDIGFDRRGGEVRLDARVLAAVQPALVQLVRNAIAHGIEPAAERQRVGKPAAGRIAIEVERRARRVVFRCRDDGRGLDVEVLRAEAVRRGAMLPVGRAPTAGELVELLLRGGISTSATVTEIAGRGIGLDVVRDAAARLGAGVHVASEPGGGTTFELDVPVSLASFDALTVADTGAVAAIPLSAVRRALRLAPGDIVTTPTGPAIVYDGGVIPFIPLTAVLGRGTPAHPGAWSAVVVEDRGKLIALGAGRLVGTATIVVRPVPELAPCDPVIGGASLDADGTPQLVLDPAGLVAAPPHALSADPPARPRILVIDDSVTTRTLEQSILESAGYEVDLAVSGEDGLARARAARYALFLVDVEMPGMDGFTFIEQTRHDPALRDIPAILVTSRASPADRARGREVGARGYIAKGQFDPAALLDQIARLVA